MRKDVGGCRKTDGALHLSWSGVALVNPLAIHRRFLGAGLLALSGALLFSTSLCWAERFRPVLSKSHLVCAQHPLAAEAGAAVLRDGGNAIDAAIATSLVLGVVEPYNSGLGGGGFALVYDAKSKRTWTLDFRERAPIRLPDARSQTGYASAAVPSLASGLGGLHERGGSKAWSDLGKEAERLARQGFLIDPVLSERLRLLRSQADLDREFQRVFFPGGRVPDLGDLFRQPDLADTLRILRRKGVREFTSGDWARRFSVALEKQGSSIRLEDLAHSKVSVRPPLRGVYRSLEIFGMGPPSSGGGILLTALGILEGFDLRQLQAGSADAEHLVAEALAISFADRQRLYGDPDFWKMNPVSLYSSSRLHSLRSHLHLDRTGRRAAVADEVKRLALGSGGGTDTSHFTIVDGAGNAVVMTQSLNTSFGSRVLVPGTGIVLNNHMDDFAPPEGGNAFGLAGAGPANQLAARKAPLSSMSPTLVFARGRPFLALGSPGGPRIISSVLQTLVNRVDHEMGILDAVSAPRLHHQFSPDELLLESGAFAPEVKRALAARGHRIVEQPSWGNVQAIEWTWQEENVHFLRGASDPRGIGVCRQ